MRNDFVTWDALKCPPKELRCILEELICKYQCASDTTFTATYDAASNIITLVETDGTNHSINLSEFSIISTTNPDGSITISQEGIIKFIIPAPCCVLVNKTPLTVVIDPNIVQTTNLNSIVTDVNGDVFYIDADGTVQQLSNATTITKTPVTETFTVTTGNTITITTLPLTNEHIIVFRNGLRELDFTQLGTLLTFTIPFGVSGGAQPSEEIIVDYFI